MGIDNIILQGPLISSLYEKNLIDLSSESTKKEATPEIVLILTDRNEEEKNETQGFLEGIISACKLPAEKVIIINIKDEKKTTIASAIKKYQPQKVLVFGQVPAEKGIQTEAEPFSIINEKDIVILHAPTLPILKADKTQKLQLWNLLKELFNIN